MAGGRFKAALDAATGASAIGLVHTFKRLERKRTASLAGGFMRKIGPLFKEHRIGRANLRASFPEKSDAEIEHILGGVWDNLGRVAIEFAHLDEFSLDGITLSAATIDRYHRIKNSGRPIIGFAAHLANWEIAAVIATLVGLRSAILYRSPNIRGISNIIKQLREPLMGELVPTSLDAPVRLARLLQSGVSVGMLADQHYTRGVEVWFFGRRCLANPTVARLARLTGYPIHGLRSIRLPDRNSFAFELTDEIEPVRDAGGAIDIAGTTQAVTTVIEGWVREHPEQWLWLHRRWR